MTDLNTTLDTIEALCTSATPGPWTADALSEEYCYSIDAGEDTVVRQAGCSCCDDGLIGRQADFQFIAESRSILPRLVAAIREVAAGHEAVYFFDREVCNICSDHGDLSWPCWYIHTLTAVLTEDDR